MSSIFPLLGLIAVLALHIVWARPVYKARHEGWDIVLKLGTLAAALMIVVTGVRFLTGSIPSETLRAIFLASEMTLGATFVVSSIRHIVRRMGGFRPPTIPQLLMFMPRASREAFWRDWLDDRDELLAQGRGKLFRRLVFAGKVAWEFRECIRGLFIQAVVGLVRMMLP